MAKPSASPNTGGGQPPVAKGPFFLFVLMMPAFIAIILVLLLAMQYKQLKAFVSRRPMELHVVPESRDAQEQVRAKLRDFLAGKPGPGGNISDTLSLDADEINHLARSSRPLADLHLGYQLDLQDTLLIARNSLPVTEINGPLSALAKLLRVHGYLNSEMKGYPELADGKIIMMPESAKMNGIPAPLSVLNAKGKLDVREWVSDKDFYDRIVASLGGLRIRGGHLLLIKRR